HALPFRRRVRCGRPRMGARRPRGGGMPQAQGRDRSGRRRVERSDDRRVPELPPRPLAPEPSGLRVPGRRLEIPGHGLRPWLGQPQRPGHRSGVGPFRGRRDPVHVFDFHVIDGKTVGEIIAGGRGHVTDRVREAYLAPHAGEFTNPPSGFLRFPDKPDCRIIALPARLGGEYGIAGLKWVSSFPPNIAANLPRASAVLLLNDGTTGYPFACIEAAQISAARTPASAAVGPAAPYPRRAPDR